MIKSEKMVATYTCETCHKEYVEGQFELVYCHSCGEHKCLPCDGFHVLETHEAHGYCHKCTRFFEALERSKESRGFLYLVEGVFYRHEEYFDKEVIAEKVQWAKENYESKFPDYTWEDCFVSLGFSPIYPDVEFHFEEGK